MYDLFLEEKFFTAPTFDGRPVEDTPHFAERHRAGGSLHQQAVTAQSPILAGRLAADGAKGISAVVDFIEQAISASGRTREVAVANPGKEALLALTNSIAANEYERKRLNSVEGVQDVEAAGSQIVTKLESDVKSVNQDSGTQRFSIVAGRMPQTMSVRGPYGIGLYLDYHNNVINSARDADFSATIY